MREIKFRAWDNVQRQMRNNGELFALDCSNEIPFLPLAKGLYSEDEHGCSANYEVMQYTGLKDKNGKEIYENDILNVTYSDLEGNPIYHKMVIRDMTDYEFMAKLNYANELEVIGNIYENV